MTDAIDPANLRVSNAERERASAILQDALDQGMITIDEYGERSAISASAKVRGELTVILADLPTALHNGTVALTSPVPAEDERPLELNAAWAMSTRSASGRCRAGSTRAVRWVT